MIDCQIFSVAGIDKSNEDYVLHSDFAPEISLVIVCDGMGGLANGAFVSRFIAHKVVDYISEYFKVESHRQVIVNAILYANEKVAKECMRLKSKMGASIGVTLFVGNSCYYSWLGDVRIYHCHEGGIKLLTKDHLAIEDNHSFITRCINGKAFRYFPDVEMLVMSTSDEILIATDGFYLHNAIGSSLESREIPEDDATVVGIKLIS